MRDSSFFEGFLLSVGMLFVGLALAALLQVGPIESWLNIDQKTDTSTVGLVALSKQSLRKTADSDQFLPIEKRQFVFLQDTLKTDADSRLIVVFGNDGAIELAQNTTVEVSSERMNFGFSKSATLITVKKGSVAQNVNREGVHFKTEGSAEVTVAAGKLGESL